jgi:hypothetical protein
VPTEDGFRSDQDEMPPPAGVEAPDYQTEEPIPGPEVESRTRTEGDLELVAQEHVLDQKAVRLREEPCECGEEDAEYLEHPGKVADPAIEFCPPTAGASGRPTRACSR